MKSLLLLHVLLNFNLEYKVFADHDSDREVLYYGIHGIRSMKKASVTTFIPNKYVYITDIDTFSCP